MQKSSSSELKDNQNYSASTGRGISSGDTDVWLPRISTGKQNIDSSGSLDPRSKHSHALCPPGHATILELLFVEVWPALKAASKEADTTALNRHPTPT